MWLEAMDGNVVSVVRLTKALLPTLRTAGWGRIVTVGTRGATIPLTNMVEYSAAKAAVVNLTVGLAQHLAGTGVTANCVTPGVIATDGLRRMFADRAEQAGWPRDWAELEPRIVADYAPNPAGRLGTGVDIAAVVAFLVSPLAGYVNGTEVRVDGGITPVA
jgi:NAD(P)-dependent dehydrogenase (short-subunit alcohol dehydrogenase family)